MPLTLSARASAPPVPFVEVVSIRPFRFGQSDDMQNSQSMVQKNGLSINSQIEKFYCYVKVVNQEIAKAEPAREITMVSLASVPHLLEEEVEIENHHVENNPTNQAHNKIKNLLHCKNIKDFL